LVVRKGEERRRETEKPRGDACLDIAGSRQLEVKERAQASALLMPTSKGVSDEKEGTYKGFCHLAGANGLYLDWDPNSTF